MTKSDQTVDKGHNRTELSLSAGYCVQIENVVVKPRKPLRSSQLNSTARVGCWANRAGSNAQLLICILYRRKPDCTEQGRGKQTGGGRKIMRSTEQTAANEHDEWPHWRFYCSRDGSLLSTAGQKIV